MLIWLAGAMSTAELGLSLAEMIRQDKVHAITLHRREPRGGRLQPRRARPLHRIPNYRELTPQDEEALLDRQLNRVTDTCIPEEEAMRRIEHVIAEEWHARRSRRRAAASRTSIFYRILRSGALEKSYQIDPRDSWLLAAAEKNLPLFVPGWEDSTLGNIFAAHCISGKVKNVDTMRSGIEYMIALADWYRKTSAQRSIGFFQIGGGIAGDFPICVVPMLHQDLRLDDIPLWGYFCQISDSTTSYGSYSGAVPNEKITWGKLGGRDAEVHHRVRRDDRRAADLRLRPRLVKRSARTVDYADFRAIRVSRWMSRARPERSKCMNA